MAEFRTLARSATGTLSEWDVVLDRATYDRLNDNRELHLAQYARHARLLAGSLGSSLRGHDLDVRAVERESRGDLLQRDGRPGTAEERGRKDRDVVEVPPDAAPILHFKEGERRRVEGFAVELQRSGVRICDREDRPMWLV